MAYPLLILDLWRYIHSNGLLEQSPDGVTLIGHSLGGKVAMMFALVFPELVKGVCSLDSPPVDRRPFAEMNDATSSMMQEANVIRKQIESMTYSEAVTYLYDKTKEPDVLAHPYLKLCLISLMINLDRESR